MKTNVILTHAERALVEAYEEAITRSVARFDDIKQLDVADSVFYPKSHFEKYKLDRKLKSLDKLHAN